MVVRMGGKAYYVRLIDDGTLDTVFECLGVRVRYDAETASDYRDPETGALNVSAFLDDFAFDIVDEVEGANQ